MSQQLVSAQRARVHLFQSHLQKGEAVLLSTANDIHYFTDFDFLLPEEREAFLVIAKETAFLIASSFSPAPDTDFFRVLRGCNPNTVAQHLEKIVVDHQVTLLYFQGQSLFVTEFLAIKNQLGSHCQFQPLDPQKIWQQRSIKDGVELKYLQQAGQIVAQ